MSLKMNDATRDEIRKKADSVKLKDQWTNGPMDFDNRLEKEKDIKKSINWSDQQKENAFQECLKSNLHIAGHQILNLNSM